MPAWNSYPRRYLINAALPFDDACTHNFSMRVEVDLISDVALDVPFVWDRVNDADHGHRRFASRARQLPDDDRSELELLIGDSGGLHRGTGTDRTVAAGRRSHPEDQRLMVRCNERVPIR